MNTITMITERLIEIADKPLKAGAHREADNAMCVMEAVAYVAGEEWTDSPKCACRVIAAFMRAWNDALPTNADRNRLLKPFIAELVGSKSTAAVEDRRSYLALDWLIRVHTPKWLDLRPELASHAKALRDLKEIADMAGATEAGVKVRAAWAAAGAAASAAAGDAARDAARDAASAAARAAAGAAASAAISAGAGAAGARAAVGDAAGAALKPTVDWLQASALDLVRRMLAVGAKEAK